jgi:hypothetical protein
MVEEARTCSVCERNYDVNFGPATTANLFAGKNRGL